MFVSVLALLVITTTSGRADVTFAASDPFQLDTRFEGSTVNSESGLFTLDTRFISAIGYADSRLFRVDTRFPTSSGSAASGFFTVDTRSSSVPNISVAGCVRNGGGGTLSGASVSAFSNNRLITRAIAGPNGEFTLPLLPVGGYELRVGMAGYATAVRLLVVVGSTRFQDF